MLNVDDCTALLGVASTPPSPPAALCVDDDRFVFRQNFTTPTSVTSPTTATTPASTAAAVVPKPPPPPPDAAAAIASVASIELVVCGAAALVASLTVGTLNVKPPTVEPLMTTSPAKRNYIVAISPDVNIAFRFSSFTKVDKT